MDQDRMEQDGARPDDANGTMATHDERAHGATIEAWWPHLSIESKHEVQALRGGPLPPVVVEEIARITGVELDSLELTEVERDFVRTQAEPVD